MYNRLTPFQKKKVSSSQYSESSIGFNSTQHRLTFSAPSAHFSNNGALSKLMRYDTIGGWHVVGSKVSTCSFSSLWILSLRSPNHPLLQPISHRFTTQQLSFLWHSREHRIRRHLEISDFFYCDFGRHRRLASYSTLENLHNNNFYY